METGEETKVLRKKEAKEELRRRKSVGLLNIQLLVVRLLSSPSFLECEERK
jgi:hypothetical protein